MAIRSLLIAAMAAVAAAECANGCSGHGDCGNNDQCICYDGFIGGDCSLRVCPVAAAFVDTPRGDLNHDGKVGYLAGSPSVSDANVALGYSKVQWSRFLQYEAWPTLSKSPSTSALKLNGNIVVPANDAASEVVGGWAAQPGEAHFVAECSGKGTCDRSSGSCRCFEGFSGFACQRTTCPSDCSGHGVCRTVKEIALAGSGKRFVESLAGDNVYAGMANPYDYRLWDAEKGTACVCDPMYGGIDCSLRTCPAGDDPLTHTQDACGNQPCIDEQQAFSVDGAQPASAPGKYRLTFTDYTGVSYSTKAFSLVTQGAAGALSAAEQAANEAAIKGALEALPNNVTGTVFVKSASPFLGGSTAAAQYRASITFRGKSGNVPEMTIAKADAADSVTRTAYIFQPGMTLKTMTFDTSKITASPSDQVFMKVYPQETVRYVDSKYWETPASTLAAVPGVATAAAVRTAVAAALNAIPAIQVEDSSRGYFMADRNVLASITGTTVTVQIAMPNKQFGANKLEFRFGTFVAVTNVNEVAVDFGDVKDGNKEFVTCSNRGICDFGSGLCRCFSGYTGSACETQSTLAM